MKILKDKKLYLFFGITLLFFGILMGLEFATDTYCVFVMDTKSMVVHFLSSGRFITALFLYIIRFFKISNINFYYLSYIIAIISTTFSLYILNNLVNPRIKNVNLSCLVTVLIIICPFSIELYLFLEKGIMMLSVLFEILAFMFLDKYFKTKNKKYFLLIFIFMILASFSYQGTLGLFVLLGGLLIIENSTNFKAFIKNNIVVALFYGLPAILNYSIVKFIFNNARVSSKIIIKESLKKIFSNMIFMLKETYKILPKYFFITIVSLLFICVLISIIKNNKQKIINILELLYLVLLGFLVIIAPQIMQSTSSIGFAPRSTYPFASLLGILVLFCFYKKINIKSKMKNVFILIVIITLFIQYISFVKIEKDRYKLNYMDSYNAKLILEKINDYEKNTGNYVKKVAYYNDEIQYTYSDLFVSGDINIKATYPEWCRTYYFSYYLNRKLTEVKFDNKVYENYFKNKKWISFDLEQVIIINDTIYIYLY